MVDVSVSEGRGTGIGNGRKGDRRLRWSVSVGNHWVCAELGLEVYGRGGRLGLGGLVRRRGGKGEGEVGVPQ